MRVGVLALPAMVPSGAVSLQRPQSVLDGQMHGVWYGPGPVFLVTGPRWMASQEGEQPLQGLALLSLKGGPRAAGPGTVQTRRESPQTPLSLPPSHQAQVPRTALVPAHEAGGGRAGPGSQPNFSSTSAPASHRRCVTWAETLPFPELL